MRLQDLHEYRKAPLGSQFSPETLSNFLVDDDNVVLLRTHVSVPNEKDLVIAKYTFDASHLVFILFNRVDQHDIAGYLFVKKVGEYWQVMETSLFGAYRGRGLGTDLYVRVVQHGYPLMSGSSLSQEAEKVWTTRLGRAVKVKVLDRQTGAVDEFSDKPALDDGPDDEQRYFYVAEHDKTRHGAILENYSATDGLSNLKYENWILNRDVLPFHGYRAVRIGLEGEM